MQRFKPWMILSILTLLGVLVMPATRSRAEDFDIDKAIAAAKTPADHEAIAAYYDKEAAESQAKSNSHAKMGAAYKNLGGSAIGKWHLDEHCDRLEKDFARAAEEAKRLAAAHREMAKQAGKETK
ncbi:MAG TPA: hypothetical protein VLF14_01925 [Candidatus Binatia bacterium]|nr:hypothetical protein [Candidatus Binatia bacterium]